MENTFFKKPILNSPYEYPSRHWELDQNGQPTQGIIATRRKAKFVTPIPKPKKRKGSLQQQSLPMHDDSGLSSASQQYDPTPIINEMRRHVDSWRRLPSPIDWVILDSDWEAEFCRVAEKHAKVKAYVKNHGLGFEVPYRYGSQTRQYRPDFIVRVDDAHADEDLLNLVVEIKGYRREDAKEKKAAMENYWVPGVNNLKHFGRWAFAEFTEVYQIEAKVEAEFDKMIDGCTHSLPPLKKGD